MPADPALFPGEPESPEAALTWHEGLAKRWQAEFRVRDGFGDAHGASRAEAQAVRHKSRCQALRRVLDPPAKRRAEADEAAKGARWPHQFGARDLAAGLFGLLLLALPAAAGAQTSTHRAPDGRYAGQATTGSDGTTRFTDAQGRNAGRAERRSDGPVQFRSC